MRMRRVAAATWGNMGRVSQGAGGREKAPGEMVLLGCAHCLEGCGGSPVPGAEGSPDRALPSTAL